MDLKNGTGSVTTGKAKKADMTLTVKDDDFAAIASGKLNAQQVCPPRVDCNGVPYRLSHVCRGAAVDRRSCAAS